MQTHQVVTARRSVLAPLPEALQEEACLVCGSQVPSLAEAIDREGALHDLGWHSWLSRLAALPSRRRLSLLRLCPECTADPMSVATSICENHGPDQMEEWICSMELRLGW